MNECWMRSVDPSGGRKHFGLAVYCARRFSGRGIPMEELIGEAEAALLWATARFRPEEGTSFTTYAVPFVLGALQELCRRSTPLYVPRRELRILSAADAFREEFRSRSGREPTLEELAEKTGVQAEKLASMLEGRQRLRASMCSPGLTMEKAAEGAGFENRILWKDAIRSLGRPYAQVIWMRFFAGMTQNEIAQKFRVSQGQISRWEKAGKDRLRQVISL